MSNCYKHETVCHKKKFVDPFTGVLTQNVESYNNKIKARIKMMYGLNIEQRRNFLIEFMFKERNTEDCFGAIIKLLKIYLYFFCSKKMQEKRTRSPAFFPKFIVECI